MAQRSKNFSQRIFGHKSAPWRGVHMGRGLMQEDLSTTREALNIDFSDNVLETRDGTLRIEQKSGTIWSVVITKRAKTIAVGTDIEFKGRA